MCRAKQKSRQNSETNGDEPDDDVEINGVSGYKGINVNVTLGSETVLCSCTQGLHNL